MSYLCGRDKSWGLDQGIGMWERKVTTMSISIFCVNYFINFRQRPELAAVVD
jgi:hypothetical protein